MIDVNKKFNFVDSHVARFLAYTNINLLQIFIILLADSIIKLTC